jgi:hypothetical protein
MWPDMQATDVQWTARSPTKIYGYRPDDNLATLDQLRNMSLPRDISSRDYANGVEYTTVGTPAASLMEVDSPTPSAGPIQEPAGNWEKRTETRLQALGAEASALSAVEREACSCEGFCFTTYRQLVDGLLQQCNMLTMERDAMARTLCAVRKDLVEQKVSQMEDGANLEDINTRLWACNSALEAKLRSQHSLQRVEPLHSSFLRCDCSSTDGNGKRKRYSDVVDLGLSRKRRRCV